MMGKRKGMAGLKFEGSRRKKKKKQGGTPPPACSWVHFSGIRKLDTRTHQDVAIRGLGFLKLDARAREDTEKIDNDVKKRAEHLHHIGLILKNEARSKLESVADQHWSDGALEADLRRADYIAKQRATEDALMALKGS